MEASDLRPRWQGGRVSLVCLGRHLPERSARCPARSVRPRQRLNAPNARSSATADREGSLVDSLLSEHHLAMAEYDQGNVEQAERLLKEGLAWQRELENRRQIAESLERFAILAVGRRQPGRAAQLLGAASMLRKRLGAPLPPIEHAGIDSTVTAVRAQLGEAAFDAAWTEGQAMTLEQAVAEALAVGTSQPDTV